MPSIELLKVFENDIAATFDFADALNSDLPPSPTLVADLQYLFYHICKGDQQKEVIPSIESRTNYWIILIIC